MGNCCDSLEYDVRDKSRNLQQGAILFHEKQKVHNVFKDRSKCKD